MTEWFPFVSTVENPWQVRKPESLTNKTSLNFPCVNHPVHGFSAMHVTYLISKEAFQGPHFRAALNALKPETGIQSGHKSAVCI